MSSRERQRLDAPGAPRRQPRVLDGLPRVAPRAHLHVGPGRVATAAAVTVLAAVVEIAVALRAGSYFLVADAVHLLAHLAIFVVLLLPQHGRHAVREDVMSCAVLTIVLAIACAIGGESVHALVRPAREPRRQPCCSRYSAWWPTWLRPRCSANRLMSAGRSAPRSPTSCRDASLTSSGCRAPPPSPCFISLGSTQDYHSSLPPGSAHGRADCSFDASGTVLAFGTSLEDRGKVADVARLARHRSARVPASSVGHDAPSPCSIMVRTMCLLSSGPDRRKAIPIASVASTRPSNP